MLLLVRPCASSADREPSRTYYQVLDISPDEQDPKVIEEAALRCSGHVRAYQLTRESECTLRLNEIARALITLLDPVRRREYDLGLGKPLGPALSERRPPGGRDTPVLPQGKSAPPAPGEDTLVLLISDGETCDVKLAYRPADRAGIARRTVEKMLTMFRSLPSPAAVTPLFREILAMCSVKRLTPTASGVALLALVLAAAPANAQGRFRIPGTGGTLNPYNYYDPYGNSRQAAFNIALYGRAISQVPAYALGYNPYSQLGSTGYAYGSPTSAYGGAYGGTAGYNPAAYSSPGYTSPGYGTGYGTGSSSSYSDPDSAILQAAASIINADGKFRINKQQANLLGEQVRSAHIENNRKAFDEFLYERANTPTWLDDLERQKKLNLRYALTNASGGEILAGSSLNTLLDSLKQMQAKGVQGPDVALSGETLDKINVSAGSGVNPALLKSERLTWPLALAGTEFQDDRKNIERSLAAAVREAEIGQIEPKRLKDLLDAGDKMTDNLGRQIGKMTPSQYIEAQNYLKLLNDGIRALGRPDAANYITGKYSAKGKTVADLVKNMSGLQFAPATPGSERAYKELYEQLVAYYNRAQQSARGE